MFLYTSFIKTELTIRMITFIMQLQKGAADSEQNPKR